MSTTTLDIYELLVEAGIKEDKAKPLAKAILSRTEARDFLATKKDLYQQGFAVVGLNLAGVAVLLQLFGG